MRAEFKQVATRNPILSGIAIIEVIVIHVTLFGLEAVPNPNHQWIFKALLTFTSFGVAHFIFISGVVLQ
jgi:surface polysaccharide O-acyltransferase-like enzyme